MKEFEEFSRSTMGVNAKQKQYKGWMDPKRGPHNCGAWFDGNIDRIQKLVAERYDIRLSEMNGRARPKMIAEARQVAMYLTREMAKLSLVEVGKAFGGRDHGTVIHACKVVNHRMDQGEDFRSMIADLKAKISSP